MIEIEGSYDIERLQKDIATLKEDTFDKFSFAVPDDVRPLMSGKYNDYIPLELLRKQYITDYIDVDDMQANF